MKTKAAEWEKMHTIHIINKGLRYEMYSEFLPIYRKNTDHLKQKCSREALYKRGHPNVQ